MARDTQIICKNIFQNSGEALKKAYTQKWIELIGQQEKNRASAAQKKH